MGRGFGGGGGGGLPGNMQKMLQDAQRMQQELLKAQEKTKEIVYEGSAGGGAVKIVASGANVLTSVAISPELMSSGDLEMLQELVLLAANSALGGVQAAVKVQIDQVTGGMKIPGL